MSDPIRLAFIGTGLIVNSSHWPAVHSLSNDFEVVALCNRTAAKAEPLAARIATESGVRPTVYSDYREMLAHEKLDAVSLALPPALNPEVAQAALEAGVHVIAEKPIAASVRDGERMLPWPARYGRVLLIAENCRYMDSFRRAARLVADGAIGRPVTAQWFLCPYIAPDDPSAQTPWRQKPVHPGGFLSDGGVHHMAVLRGILGEATAAQASVASVRPDLPPADTLSAVINWTSGALATYQVSYAVPGPYLPLSIVGTQGAIVASEQWVELQPYDGAKQRWEDPSPFGGMLAMYADFAQAIRTGQLPLATPVEALADLRLVVAMLESGEQGQRVKIAAPLT